MKNRSPKIPLIARSAGVVALTLLFLGSARAQSNFDWKQASGTKLVVMLNKHPYADAIIKRLQEFKDLTGIDVETSETPEENYFDKLTAALASKNGTPDVFMTGTYQLWDYATAGYMEPLDSYLKDPSQTNPEYDYTDIFEGVRNGGKWDLIPGHPTGTGSQWALPLGFETNIIAYNKKWAQLVKDAGPPAWSNYTWYQCGADFGAGKAAILFDADILGYFQNVPGGSAQAGNIAYSPPPVMKEGDPVGANEWIWQVAINKSSKSKKAAWLFVQYFTGKEHGTWAAINASVVDPPRKSVWDNKDFQAVMAMMPGYLDTL